MGKRTQLKPQSPIHRKSSSRNKPSSLYGKYFIQSGSVEKYSSRLKPYQDGFFAALALLFFLFGLRSRCKRGATRQASGQYRASSRKPERLENRSAVHTGRGIVE